MNRSRLAFALGLLAAALLLGGCSEDPVPKVAPASESASASESPSPSGSAEPTMPAVAKERSATGARAFVRYYLEVLNYAQRSGDVATLRDLSDDQCSACTGYLEAIDKTYSGGGRVRGGALSIGRLRELPKDYGADWGGFAKGESTPQVIVDGSGHRDAYPGGSFSLFAYSTWVNDSWRMRWMRTPM